MNTHEKKGAHNIGQTLALLLTTLVVVTLASCSGDETVPTKSIDEIHQEEGVPVQTRVVEPAPFRTYLSFTSSVSGAAESVASAMVSDEIAGILYEVGDYVEKDTAVVLFPPDNPSLNWAQTRVAFESAQTAFERVQSLYEDDGISQQAYDDARTGYEVARANWQMVQDMARVKAPISGYITRINVFPSDNVHAGDPLFTVSDLEELKTTVWLTDRQIDAVEVGQVARAFWQDKEAIGTVVQVDMAMDQSKKAFATKLRFDNPGLEIQSGVTALIEIETYRNEEAIILNQQEIIDTGDSQSVFVARDGVALRTPIEIDRRQGLFVEVASGLQPGDQVVTRGVELIGDGVAIRVVDQADRLVQR